MSSCVAVQPAGQVGQAQQPIVHGDVDEAHPAAVALTYGGRMFCSGAVIGPRTVLTAAHCVAQRTTEERSMGVYFGTTVGASGTTIAVVRVTVHPDYYLRADRAPMNDVAVLLLAGDAPVAPFVWQQADLADIVGRTVTLIGYGVTDAREQSGHGIRRVTHHVVSRIDSAFIFHAGDTAGTCNGDSGGPMVLDVDGTPTVVGITSWGDEGCALFGGNTRVDALASFIAPLLARSTAPAHSLAQGQACDDHVQCTSGLCSGTEYGGEGFCTHTCRTDADCEEASACEPTAAGRLCGPAGSAVGGCEVAEHGRSGNGPLCTLPLLALLLAFRRASGRGQSQASIL